MSSRRSVSVMGTALVLSLGAGTAFGQDLSAGNPDAGKAVYFNRCIRCHEPPSLEGLTQEELDRNEAALPADASEANTGRGPSLTQLLGRKAGTVPGFAYSAAMRNSGVVWTEETLAVFLKNPAAMIPDSDMKFKGLVREGELENLMAYLADAAR